MRFARQQFWRGFWALAVLFAIGVTWFFGNLLYTLLWKALADDGVPINEAQIAGYISAHLIPFALILIAFALFATLIRHHLVFDQQLPAVARIENTFGVGQAVYRETSSIMAPDGRIAKLYENKFYIIVSNVPTMAEL